MAALFPGDRRVWIVAGALAAVVLALAGYYMLRPGEYYTGTNSVVGRSPVASVAPGSELCVKALDIPARTGRVRLLVAGGGQKSLNAVVRGSGLTSTGSAVAGHLPGPAAVDIPVSPVWPDSPPSRHGSVCVRVEGAATEIWGTANLQRNDVPPTLDGARFDHRVAVWFMPPPGERTSRLALWADMAERAARFRPGWVGAWTYWGIFFVLIPALAYVALRALALAAAGTRARLALAVFGVALLNGAAWSLVTPTFQAPDEMEHHAYAQYLAETGKAPVNDGGRAPRSAEEATVLDVIRLVSSHESPSGRPPWLPADDRRLERDSVRYAPLRRDDGGGPSPAVTHSPLYYSLLAPAYHAASGGSFFDRVWAMRLVSALLGALTALFAFLLVRELAPRHPVAAVAAGLLVAFQPMFGFISGALNNDNGVNAAAALLLWLLVRGLRRGLTWRLGLAIAATLVAAPLMKGTAYALYPAAVLALLGMLWRRHSRRDLPAFAALAGGFVALQAGWSALAPVFSRDVFTTPGGSAPTSEGPIAEAIANPGGYLSYLWQVFLPPLPFQNDIFIQAWPFYDIYVERGWGAFGWYAILFPGWVYAVIVAAMALAGAGAIAVLLRERAAARERILPLLVIAAAVAGVVAAVAAAYYTPVGGRAVVPEQGRYAFTAIGGLAAIAAGSAYALGRRHAVPLLAALVTAVIGLGYAGQLLEFTSFYS